METLEKNVSQADIDTAELEAMMLEKAKPIVESDEQRAVREASIDLSKVYDFRIGDNLETFMRRNKLEDKESATGKWRRTQKQAWAKASARSANDKVTKVTEKFVMRDGEWKRRLTETREGLALAMDANAIEETMIASKVKSAKAYEEMASALLRLPTA